MKVLFVAKELRMDPLGIMYLSAQLKHEGHEVELARMDDKKASGHDVVKRFQPDVLAYSMCSGLECFYEQWDKEFRKLINHRVRSMWGGPAVTFDVALRARLSQGPDNMAFGGECEKSFAEYLRTWEEPKPSIVDLDEVLPPDRAIAYQFESLRNNPIKNVLTRRGCHYGCSYCFNRDWNKMFRKQLPKGIYRYHSPERVVEECRQVMKDWPVEMFNFVDDNYASSEEWLEEFAPIYKKEIGLPFFCSVRPEDAQKNGPIIPLIKAAGGWIVNMAIESANKENRKRVLIRGGKGLQPVIDTINEVHKHGMVTRLQNIVGLPVEDPLADAYETLDFNIMAKPTSSWAALLQPYRGTKVNEIAEAGGFLAEDHVTDEEFFGRSALKIRDKRKVERLHKLWPLLTCYPIFRKIAPLLIRIPLPFSWFTWFFKYTKKHFAERDLWVVCRKKSARDANLPFPVNSAPNKKKIDAEALETALDC